MIAAKLRILCLTIALLTSVKLMTEEQPWDVVSVTAVAIIVIGFGIIALVEIWRE